VFSACPQCVNTVRIDPKTGLAPDTVMRDGKAVHNPNPDPAAVARAVPTPVCDPCVIKRNEVNRAGGPAAAHHTTGQVMTAEERHGKFHKGEYDA
jgi:hypothetical protein